MRTRTLLAAVLAAGLVLGAASMASAAEPGGEGGASATTVPANVKDAGETQVKAYECFEEQIAAATPDFTRCVQAPSLLLPATNELIWTSIAFFVTLLLLWKFAYPGLKKGMENRSEKIRLDLQAAEDARAEADGLKAEYEQRLATAKQEATRVIEDARATADSLKAELAQRAEGEIAEMRQRAAADVESMKGQVMADLQHEVAQIAIGAAEAVVQKNLDQATQVQLVESYIASVGSKN